MQDKTLKCRDCNADFVFTAGEQEFYAQKGFSEPTRCSSCRAARKASRGEGGYSGAREREMYPAVCAQCGKDTEVPFQPRSDRPVYCSDCYAAQHTGGGADRGRRTAGGGRYSSGSSRGRGHRDDRW